MGVRAPLGTEGRALTDSDFLPLKGPLLLDWETSLSSHRHQ